MKLLGLEFSSNFLWLKNELNLFHSKEIHEKGGPALKWAVSEPSTLMDGTCMWWELKYTPGLCRCARAKSKECYCKLVLSFMECTRVFCQWEPPRPIPPQIAQFPWVAIIITTLHEIVYSNLVELLLVQFDNLTICLPLTPSDPWVDKVLISLEAWIMSCIFRPFWPSEDLSCPPRNGIHIKEEPKNRVKKLLPVRQCKLQLGGERGMEWEERTHWRRKMGSNLKLQPARPNWKFSACHPGWPPCTQYNNIQFSELNLLRIILFLSAMQCNGMPWPDSWLLRPANDCHLELKEKICARVDLTATCHWAP